MDHLPKRGIKYRFAYKARKYKNGFYLAQFSKDLNHSAAERFTRLVVRPFTIMYGVLSKVVCKAISPNIILKHPKVFRCFFEFFGCYHLCLSTCTSFFV